MIDFLQKLPSVMKIEHYHQYHSFPAQSYINEEVEDQFEINNDAEPTSSDWIDASYAINVCVQIYGDRVDNLLKRMNKFVFMINCTQTMEKGRNMRNILDSDGYNDHNHNQHRKNNSYHTQHNNDNNHNVAQYQHERPRRRKKYITTTTEIEKINMNNIDIRL